MAAFEPIVIIMQEALRSCHFERREKSAAHQLVTSYMISPFGRNDISVASDFLQEREGRFSKVSFPERQAFER
jgi:hypothetical protein